MHVAANRVLLFISTCDGASMQMRGGILLNAPWVHSKYTRRWMAAFMDGASKRYLSSLVARTRAVVLATKCNFVEFFTIRHTSIIMKILEQFLLLFLLSFTNDI